MIYNDAYSEFAGQRHPKLLGSKVLEGWAEVADFNAKVLEVGLVGGTLSFKDQELTLYRNNVAEQVWMDLNYGPVLGEDNKSEGVMSMGGLLATLAQRRVPPQCSRRDLGDLGASSTTVALGLPS
ncbi:hypothetical protein [Bradyrhizobium sp. AZCC 2230]|uniref:hypothetical protein n=1 Tax=Bradyrhizobium sp. AZCC 2230 TaxID=3117021 RepID=UPI002FF242A7